MYYLRSFNPLLCRDLCAIVLRLSMIAHTLSDSTNGRYSHAACWLITRSSKRGIWKRRVCAAGEERVRGDCERCYAWGVARIDWRVGFVSRIPRSKEEEISQLCTPLFPVYYLFLTSLLPVCVINAQANKESQNPVVTPQQAHRKKTPLNHKKRNHRLCRKSSPTPREAWCFETVS